MTTNAVILTEEDLKKGADKERPRIEDLNISINDLAKLDFVAYAHEGELLVLKSRYGNPGLYQMTFGELCMMRASLG